MREIPLTQGRVAIVDDEDYEALNAFKWNMSRRAHTVYAGRHARRKDGRCTREYMHRVVLAMKLRRPLAKGEQTDHINGEGLDNRRENLRLATRSQNLYNRHHRTDRPNGG